MRGVALCECDARFGRWQNAAPDMTPSSYHSGPRRARNRRDAMKMRRLGRNGPQVSAIGLGCMGFSEFYASDAATDADAIGVIQSALSLGVNFLDTADMYGPFTNEVLVGKAIAGKRGQVFLATKFGFQR